MLLKKSAKRLVQLGPDWSVWRHSTEVNMGLRFFSDKDRPVHLGPYPLERLKRLRQAPDFNTVPAWAPVSFRRPDAPDSIVNAMGDYQAMLVAIRDGMVNKTRATIPADPLDRSNHLKAFGYFSDASMVGICRLPGAARLDQPVRNPDIDRLAEELRSKQTKTRASGIDVIMDRCIKVDHGRLCK